MGDGKKVRCADCGFLTARRPSDGSLLEIDREARETGRLDGGVYLRAAAPLCFVHAQDIRQETVELTTSGSKQAILEVISLERECSEFCEWSQGFSPKEHADMIQAKEMQEAADRREREMREWQAEQKHLDAERQERQRKEDREWQAEQRRTDLERQERQRKEDQERQERQRKEDQERQEKQETSRRRYQFWMMVAAAILAALFGIITGRSR